MTYDSVNPTVLGLIPTDCRSVLDLGCGGGSLGQAVRGRGGVRVTGVTFSEAEAAEARPKLDAVVVADLNTLDPASLGGPFDCVVCSHVLEHLYRPDLLLTALRPVLAPGAAVVVALPNLLYWRQRARLLAGRFRYTDGGIMDRTHYRFFDWHTARELLTGAGYAVEVATADGGWPLSRLLPAGRRAADRLALRAAPGLFGWQFAFRARPKA